MSNAPIILFCYNRIDHLKKTISSLKKSQLSKFSDLIIFSDGPKNSSDNFKILKIRKYLEKIKGFKSVKIYKKKENKGLALSIVNGLNLIFKKYSSAIILEDDLIVSKNFLTYMNDGLNYFKSNDKVISIHGYSYPFKEKKK
jgi:GT2 family glycosyltransferase